MDRLLSETHPQLLVLDPIMNFLHPSVNIANDQSVRRALRPLRRLARKHRSAVLLVLHLNKSAGRRALYRGMASIAFTAACRSVWLVAPDPAAPSRRVLAEVKNNFAPHQPSLAYELPAGPGVPLTLSWLGPSPCTADQLLAVAPKPPRPSATDLAHDFVTAFLADAPRTTKDIWTAAQQKGLAVRTLQRVRKELAIRSERVFMDGKPVTYWLLASQRLPGSVAAAADDLEPWLAPLREMYPPPNPLDDPA